MNTDNENTKRKCFDNEYLANEFAKSVNGRVEFRPLPDYMGVIPNWVVYYSD